MNVRFAILAVCFILGASAAVRGQNPDGGDDINPNNPPANFWMNNGRPTPGVFYTIDANGTVNMWSPIYWVVLTNPIAGHCKDFNGVLYSHRHFNADYASVADANRYWDARYNYDPTNPNAAFPTRVADATDNGNCFTQALNDCCAGIWMYWLDTSCVGANPGATNAIPDSINGSTKTIPVAQVQALDILFYANGTAGGGEHASYVFAVNTSGDTIQWKYLGSGLYKWTEPGGGFLGTPLKWGKNPQPNVYYPSSWQWDPIGAGDDGQLIPAGNVHRPNPSKN